MIKIIDELFKSNELMNKEIPGGKVYFYDDSNGKEAFWLVIEENDIEKLIDKQSELFNACKKVCQSPALDKNISMLILWDTGGKIEIQKMKEHIMSVEEDQYYFKKYVLYFSCEELQDLKQQMKDDNIADFIKEQIVLPNTFAEYKEDSIKQHQTWRTLIYRVSMKLPFMDVKVERSEKLESLFINNDDKLNNLLKFKNGFFTESDNYKTLPSTPEDWLEMMSPLLEEKNNGN